MNEQDASGAISITEVIASLEIENRVLFKENQTCIEYYWLKDGITTHAICLDNNNWNKPL